MLFLRTYPENPPNPRIHKENMRTPHRMAPLVDPGIELKTFLLWGDGANHWVCLSFQPATDLNLLFQTWFVVFLTNFIGFAARMVVF